jgi:hypothetical protein
MATGERWSPQEIDAAVADYCDMLLKQERGESFRKVDHYKPLIARLGRTKPSVEMRYENISAALILLDAPWVSGYAPLTHGATLVLPYVAAHLDKDLELRRAITKRVAAVVPEEVIRRRDLEEVDPPKLKRRQTGHEEEEAQAYQRRRRHPTNWLEREARNASVGRSGELLVMKFEQHRLESQGRADLSRRVVHTSLEDDGAGFDVLSFEGDGTERERAIEVKSTAYGKETPFYVSRNEVAVSKERGSSYHLYRVFELRDAPKLFTVAGALEDGFSLSPEIFRARVA